MMPKTKSHGWLNGVIPPETSPHIRAHMGGNHVMGFRSWM